MGFWVFLRKDNEKEKNNENDKKNEKEKDKASDKKNQKYQDLLWKETYPWWCRYVTVLLIAFGLGLARSDEMNDPGGGSGVLSRRMGLDRVLDPMIFDAPSDQALVEAFAGEAEVLVVEMLKRGMNPNSLRFADGRSALMVAAARGMNEAVEILLALPGLEMNGRDEYGGTALMAAAQRGYGRVVRLLLAHDQMEVNAVNKFGWTAFLLAAQMGQTEVVKAMAADPRVQFDNPHSVLRTTPLMLAAAGGHLEIVRFLLSLPGARARLNLRDHKRRTAIMLASENRHPEVVRYLLDQPHLIVGAKDRKGSSGALLSEIENEIKLALAEKEARERRELMDLALCPSAFKRGSSSPR